MIRKLLLIFYKIKYCVFYYILGTVALIEDNLYRSYNKCELKCHTGEVAVITGGARGIGAVIVKQLLKCDMHVVIGCRDVSKGRRLVERLRAEGITTGFTSILPLDMASLDSVRAFATVILKDMPQLHILINNAGVMFPPYCETADGMESQWEVNYMGHFLLSHLLFARLESTALTCGGKTKIVNISSCAHLAAYPIDFSNINMKENFTTQAAYAQSKLAQLMFTKYLDTCLQSVHSPVAVVAVHPGIVNTDIFNGTVMKILTPWAPGLLFKTPEEGATTVVFAAFNGQGGEYISNCRPGYISKLALDKKVQEQLFIYTLKTLGIERFGNLDRLNIS